MAGMLTSASKQRSLWILAWATIPVVCLAFWVQVTGSGIDLLVFATACLVLLTLERTVGDWLGELVGAALAGVIFALLVSGTIYYFFADSSAGRSHTDSFFVAADKRGYKTTYYRLPLPDGSRGLPSQVQLPAPRPPVVVAAPVATNGGGETNGDGADQAPASSNGDQSSAATTPGEPKGASPTEYVWRKARPLWARFFPESTVAVPSMVTLDLEPRKVAPALRTVLRAVVTSNGSPVVNGSVDFAVNERGVGRIILDSHGMAATHFSTYIEGTYSVTARYSGSAEFAASASAPIVLTVGK
jgi:hypothetical protein